MGGNKSMWPFTKKLPVPIETPDRQVSMYLKSVSLPEATPRWSLFAKRQENWNPEVAIKEGYNASAIVYACIEKRAKLLAAVPWRAQQKRGGEWVDMPESPLQRLIDRPNPEQSLYELIYEASQSLDLAGNAFISEIKGGTSGLPFELWLLPAQHMLIKPGRERLISYFEYAEQGIGRIRIEPEDMIQLKMPNPNSRWFGMPPLMAAGRAADVDRESADWQKSSLQNRGVLDIQIEVPETLSKEQRDEIRDKLTDRQTGPANARKPIVSSGKVHQLGQNAVEMDFVASRKAVWLEISAVFGIPLAMLGFTEDVNLANSETMRKMVYEDTIIPQLDLMGRQLNHQLSSEFGPDWRIEPDLSNVEALQENLGDKLANADKLWRMGVPFDQINERFELGFEPFEGSDVGYLPGGLLPAGFDNMPEPPATPDELDAQKRLAYGE
jgi:HK97 family phage portal protein